MWSRGRWAPVGGRKGRMMVLVEEGWGRGAVGRWMGNIDWYRRGEQTGR